jgi:hypothetical protein
MGDSVARGMPDKRIAPRHTIMNSAGNAIERSNQMYAAVAVANDGSLSRSDDISNFVWRV